MMGLGIILMKKLFLHLCGFIKMLTKSCRDSLKLDTHTLSNPEPSVINSDPFIKILLSPPIAVY